MCLSSFDNAPGSGYGHGMYGPTKLPSRRDLHGALRTAAKSIPRYLFRAWSARSGGDSRLNTSDTITPLAYLGSRKGSQDIFAMSPTKLHDLINGHLSGSQVLTVFSSWSHSLPFVLCLMAYKHDAYLSVIDTQQLRPENFVFYCGSAALAPVGIHQFEEEFLVFGVVDGGAHQAVPFARIKGVVQDLAGPIPENYYYEWSAMEASMFPEQRATVRPGQKRSTAEDVKRATAFGKNFGPAFELPMAICWLAIKNDIVNDENLHVVLITTCNVPEAWTIDRTFPAPTDEARVCAKESLVASQTFAVLVKKLRKLGRLPSVEEGEADLMELDGPAGGEVTEEGEAQDGDADEQTLAIEEAGRAAKPLQRSSRMPREVYQLYVDMVGYDEHNAAVRR